MLQAHNHRAINYAFSLIILPASEQSYRKLVAARASVDFV